MTNETVEQPEQKFFFDQHDFADDAPPEIDPDNPPPPVFSQAELDRAKKAGFQEGHLEATQSEKQSRSHHLSIVMNTLSQDMARLFAQESAREALYEREAVQLALSTLEKLFPFYAEKTGFEEMKTAMENVIQQQSGKKAVLVRVSPDLTDGVEAFLKKLQTQNDALRFTVKGDETIVGTACALSWENGGALHNTQAMADEVLSILQDGLAGGSAKGHDKKEELEQQSQSPDETSESSVLEERPDE